MGLLVNVLQDIMKSRTRASLASDDFFAGTGPRLYLDLLKRCVSNTIYDDDLDLMRGSKSIDPATGKYVTIEAPRAEQSQKFYGGVWPSRAHTMIGMPRLDNLQFCVESVLKDGVPGDLIETGVWRGGASIFMRGILKAYGVVDRLVWVADSFEGLPSADLDRYPKETTMKLDLCADLAVSLERVQSNFASYGLLDDRVRFLKGWFRDTLPTAPMKRIAVMRLDGDLYESTMDALGALYPKLSPGGFVIIDDYNALQCCNEAVADFRAAMSISAPLETIPGCGAFWRKESA